MTRSHKANDRNHKSEDNIPKYFAKHGHIMDPNKVKRNGHGKTNWGDPIEDVDLEEFNFTRCRRYSNSRPTQILKEFRTKFDMNEEDPVFEETIHGPVLDTQSVESTSDMASPVDAVEGMSADGHPLTKTRTADSSASSTF